MFCSQKRFSSQLTVDCQCIIWQFDVCVCMCGSLLFYHEARGMRMYQLCIREFSPAVRFYLCTHAHSNQCNSRVEQSNIYCNRCGCDGWNAYDTLIALKSMLSMAYYATVDIIISTPKQCPFSLFEQPGYRALVCILFLVSILWQRNNLIQAAFLLIDDQRIDSMWKVINV